MFANILVFLLSVFAIGDQGDLVTSPELSQKKIEVEELLILSEADPRVSVDLGKLMASQKYSLVFKYRNDSRTPILIDQVKTSCGCMVGYRSKSIVKPGEESDFHVLLSASKSAGRSTKTIQLMQEGKKLWAVDVKIEFLPAFESSKAVVFVEDKMRGKVLELDIKCNDLRSFPEGFRVRATSGNIVVSNSDSVFKKEATLRYRLSETVFDRPTRIFERIAIFRPRETEPSYILELGIDPGSKVLFRPRRVTLSASENGDLIGEGMIVGGVESFLGDKDWISARVVVNDKELAVIKVPVEKARERMALVDLRLPASLRGKIQGSVKGFVLDFGQFRVSEFRLDDGE